jgi:hypothetical protein
MKKDAGKLRAALFLFAVGVIFLTATSGYLYRQNKNYQYQNQRLIILNDSILSENIELKNTLQQKKPTVFKAVPENFKKKENR